MGGKGGTFTVGPRRHFYGRHQAALSLATPLVA